MSLYKIAAYCLEKNAHLNGVTFKKMGDKIHLIVNKDHITKNEEFILKSMQGHYNGKPNVGWDPATGATLFKNQAGKELPKELLDPTFKAGNFKLHITSPKEAGKEYFLANHHKLKGYKPTSIEQLHRDAERYANDYYHNDMKKYEGTDAVVNHNNELTKKYNKEDMEVRSITKQREKQNNKTIVDIFKSNRNNKMYSNKQNNTFVYN